MTRRRRLDARVLEFVRVHGLLPPGTRVLAAVSGGADSMVLASVLGGLRDALAIDVAIGHVDHGLRRGSSRDAAFVRRQAAAMALPFHGVAADVRGRIGRTGESVETAARAARYEALDALAREAGATRIATGHTATDQAETVLMRLLRGTGPLGLAGIGTATAAGVVRPLLCATADEVRAWASDRGIPTREDPTNRDPRHFRNRVRADLLPRLRAENPRVDFVLADLADDAATLARAIDGLLDPGAADGPIRVPRPDGPDPLLPYRVRAAYERATGAPLGLSRPHLDAIVRLLATPGSTGEVHLPRRTVARIGRDGLVLERIDDGPPPGSARRERR